MKKLPRIKCNRWRSGVCLEFAVPQDSEGVVVYCPRARAAYAEPGECCHHPLYTALPKLKKMRQAGVKLDRYGDRLESPEFVERLWVAFSKARVRRSAASS